MSLELLAATTSGGASSHVCCYEDQVNATLPATFFCSPQLAGAEEGQLQISTDGGTTFIPVISDTDDGKITATRTTVAAYSTGIYRILMSATATATAAKVSVKNNM